MVEKILRKIAKKCIILMKINKKASILNKNDITQENCAIFDAFLLIFIRIIHFLAIFRNIFSTISLYFIVNLYISNIKK